MCIISQVCQADLTAKDDVIARNSRELGNKDIQLAQKDTLIADKEATIIRALAEREALIQVARPAVTLCPWSTCPPPLLVEMFTDLYRHTGNRLSSKMLSWQGELPTFNSWRYGVLPHVVTLSVSSHGDLHVLYYFCVCWCTIIHCTSVSSSNHDILCIIVASSYRK